MPARQAPEEIDEAVDHEQPGEEEMPAPAGREILVARHGDPGRKAARRHPPVLDRGAEHARGVERMAEDAGLSDEASSLLARREGECRMREIGLLPDIERRMRVEDLQAAHQKEREAEHIDPMRQTQNAGMA